MRTIKQKLVVCMLLISIIPMLFIGTITYVLSSQSMKLQAEQSLNNMAQQVYDMIEQVQKVQEKEISGYLNLAEQNFYSLGNIHNDSSEIVQAGKYQMPALKSNQGTINNNFEFVDNISKLTGANATIFQFYNSEFIRISTNVKDSEGKRAVGTSIKSDSPVFKELVKGKNYIGRANVAGQMYITGYAPIKDTSGNIIGAVFVGKPEGSSELSEKIGSLKIGKTGHVYLIDSKGNLIIKKDGKENIGDNGYIKDIISRKNGLLEYYWEGNKKISAFKYFEKWDWYVITVVNKNEILKNTTDLMLMIAGVCISLILLVIVFGYFIANGVSTPINQLVKAFEAMKAGNLTNRIKVETKDEISLLAESFNQMNNSLIGIIKEVQNSSNSVSIASKGLSEATDHSGGYIEQIARNINEIASGTRDNALLIKQTESNVYEVTKGLQTVATTASEINSLSNNINVSATKGETSVKQIVNIINDIYKSFQKKSIYLP